MAFESALLKLSWSPVNTAVKLALYTKTVFQALAVGTLPVLELILEIQTEDLGQ